MLTLLQLVIQNFPDPLWVKDPHGTFLLCNPPTEELIGAAASEIIGKNDYDFFDRETADRFRVHDLTALETKQPGINEEWLKFAATGYHGLFETRKIPIFFPDGTALGVLGTTRDISAEHKTKQDLRLAKEEADLANQAKSEFLTNVSHELRTPLNAIMGLSYLLKSSADNKLQPQIDKISSATSQLNSLINNILDFSKIEAGKVHLNQRDFHPQETIASLGELIRKDAEKKNLILSIDSEALPDRLHGDEQKLKQILLNFLGNAIKFTDQGSVILSCSALDKNDQQLWYRFTVSDSGCGICHQQLTQIFTAFVQADASISRKHGGTGIGLTIASRLAELMGGEIGVESQPGEGSHFWVELPFSPARKTEAAANHSPLAEAETTPATSSNWYQQLRDMEGIDLAQGLRCVNNKSERLRNLLIRFCQEHADDARQIATELEAGRTSDARRLAHSLKGLAGTLGLTDVQNKAMQLESQLKAAESSAANALTAALNALEQSLLQTIQKLTPLLQTVVEAVAEQTQSWATLQPQLELLLELLVADDLRATHHYQDLAGQLQALFPQQTKQLAKLINDFSFDEAASLLKQLIQDRKE